MVSALLAALAAIATPDPLHCGNLLAAAPSGNGKPSRAVAPIDLARLRDFGPMGVDYGNETLFALSPDRRSVAIALRRAEPAANAYCLGLVIVDVATGRARVVDRGGDLIRVSAPHGGSLAGFGSGVPSAVTPAWSPDGRSLAFLKRTDDSTQVWRVSVDGSGARQLTHGPDDASAVTWKDRRTLIVRRDETIATNEAMIDREGLGGWRVDDRFFPAAAIRPYPVPPAGGEAVVTIDLSDGSVAPASAADRAALDRASRSSRAAITDDGPVVERVPADPASYVSPQLLRVRALGRDVICRLEACSQARAFWLERGGTSVLFMARSGWGGGSLTFYRWNLVTGRVRTLSTTSRLLLGCESLEQRLLCAREAPTEPRRLVVLDPVSGRWRTLFNPNPDYDRLRQGTVERLRLTALNGSRTFADLMLPPDYRKGRRYPLVVVQYESRGFLRGGTGDEFPIPAFAAAGMAVLSFERPRDVFTTVTPPATTFEDAVRIDTTNWADRRNVHAALADAVGQLIATGLIDPERVGITGLSDGIATAAFALLNSDIFAAAALSGCCEEPMATLVLQGSAFAGRLRHAGFPPLGPAGGAFWRDYGVALEPRRVRAPLLIQAADRELLLSLPTVAALREAGRPVDVYAFPDEYHVKWQPAHRLAVYERAVRWFQFWFGLPAGPNDPPRRDDEIARWERLRAMEQASAP